MADPLTLIAAGAAVGGLAGKFAEKTWEFGERWLRDRFGSHAAEAQEQARENAAQFVQQLAIQVNLLEDKRAVDPDRLSATERHPQFSALLQKSVLNAAQTDNEDKHKLLARLVATRLSSDAETTVSLASQLASDAIARSTQRQIRLMALACFLEDIRPRDRLEISEYRQWLEVFLSPFTELEFKQSDANHLVAIACATYNPESNRDLQILLQMKCGTRCIRKPLEDIAAVNILQIQWNEGFAGVRLTSVGSIVGGLALDHIMGIDAGLPKWD